MDDFIDFILSMRQWQDSLLWNLYVNQMTIVTCCVKSVKWCERLKLFSADLREVKRFRKSCKFLAPAFPSRTGEIAEKLTREGEKESEQIEILKWSFCVSFRLHAKPQFRLLTDVAWNVCREEWNGKLVYPPAAIAARLVRLRRKEKRKKCKFVCSFFTMRWNE